MSNVSVPREILGLILNALDRDAAEGKAVRGEIAQELRAILSAPAGEADSEVVADLAESRLAENLRLKLANEFATRVADDLLAEDKALRDQFDEARELLNDSRNKINYMMQNGEWYQPQLLLERIDAWLEANK